MCRVVVLVKNTHEHRGLRISTLISLCNLRSAIVACMFCYIKVAMKLLYLVKNLTFKGGWIHLSEIHYLIAF